MPNFSTAYANACGVKLPKECPDFPSSFIELPEEKYITLHCGAGHPARIYDFYNEVCSLLAKPLHDNNISIIQIGSEKETAAQFTIDYRGKTTLKQCSFVIENALLHLGNDSCWAHLAGMKGIPLINLCPNSPASVVSPHYHSEIFSFESEKKGKWTYDPNEKPKSINTIKPELIAAKVLEFLGIENNIKVDTILVGEFFNHGRVIDYVPDFPVKAGILKGSLNCRADMNNNQEAIGHFFSLYKGVLIMDSEIDLGLIKHLRNNIVKIAYKLDNKYNVDYLEALIKIGVPYLLSYCGDEAGLQKARFDLFDFDCVWKKSKMGKPNNENITENTYFRTRREIISDYKSYPSQAHFRDKKNFNGEFLKLGEYLNDELFWENKEHYYLFNQNG